MVPVSDMLGLVLPRRSRTAPLLVGIDGRSRSGKSTLAALIARCIQEVVVVHTDDIAWHHSFFGWSDVLIEGVLRPLRRGGLPLSCTPQPWIERGRPGSIVIPGGTEIILVEGVGAARRELSNWFDATVGCRQVPTSRWHEQSHWTEIHPALSRTGCALRTPASPPTNRGHAHQRWWRASIRSAETRCVSVCAQSDATARL